MVRTTIYEYIGIYYVTAVKEEDIIMFVVIYNESTYKKLQNTDDAYQKNWVSLNKYIDKWIDSYTFRGLF